MAHEQGDEGSARSPSYLHRVRGYPWAHRASMGAAQLPTRARGEGDARGPARRVRESHAARSSEGGTRPAGYERSACALFLTTRPPCVRLSSSEEANRSIIARVSGPSSIWMTPAFAMRVSVSSVLSSPPLFAHDAQGEAEAPGALRVRRRASGVTKVGA